MTLLGDLLSWPNIAVALIGAALVFIILVVQCRRWSASVERSHVDTQEKLMKAARTLTSGSIVEFSSYDLGVAVEELYGQKLSYGGIFRALAALEERGDLLSRWKDPSKKLYRLRAY